MPRTFLRSLVNIRPVWPAWLAGAALVALTVPFVIYLPLIQKELIDDVLLAGRADLLLPTLTRFGAVWLVIPVAQVLGSVLRTYVDERIAFALRQRLFDHCARLSVPFWHREHSGRTMALFTSDAPALASLLGSTLITSFGQILMLLGGALVMVQLSPLLACVVILIPALVASAVAVFTRPLRGAGRTVQDKAAEVSQRLHEALAGLREIAAFGQEHTQTMRLAQTMQDLLRLRMRLAYISAALGAGQSVFSLTLTVILLGLGGYLVLHGETTLGTVLAVQQIYGQVYPTAMALTSTVINAQRVLASADRIHEFLDQQPLVPDQAPPPPSTWFPGDVRFEDVGFAYSPGQRVLAHVSFSVSAGELVALVGPSGAGKSTLVTLLARFYDPDRGRILVGGTDVRALPLTTLRGQIGMVFQDPFLFAGTIRENILLGRPDASDVEVVSAARASQAWEFVERLPHGLDTYVGQRGVQLSEGQKQRLAIARALLRNPRILILDEPTSALDARSEHLLQTALDNVVDGRTTFVIAHRLATVRRANRILVLDDGKIVEQGTHADLVRLGGLYASLSELQAIPTGLAEPVTPALSVPVAEPVGV